MQTPHELNQPMCASCQSGQAFVCCVAGWLYRCSHVANDLLQVCHLALSLGAITAEQDVAPHRRMPVLNCVQLQAVRFKSLAQRHQVLNCPASVLEREQVLARGALDDVRHAELPGED